MDINGIRARVAAIRESARDCEVAHSMEDSLHRDVLAEIAGMGATGGVGYKLTDPWNFAAEALKSTEIEFPRHCA